ncbi:MAG: site-specific DNA-methyltransferase [Leptolyngbyaceae cyanobacterium RU_5_1]|nr:site-specific DNA-methyltransferase [Leptolyngbyaceae cyanobacterium RU_5_1]
MAGSIAIACQHPNGILFCGDSLVWLPTLPDASADLIIADPPYNLKKADWDTFASQDSYIDWSTQWIAEAARVLKPTGTLYIMGFSEILADLKRPACKYFKACRWLIWHYKNKANLGNDWGRSHESILLLRKTSTAKMNIDNIRIPYGNHTLKYPHHPQAATSQYGNGKHHTCYQGWTPNPLGAKPKDVIELPTTCNGMHEKTPHPTQKPEELIRKFVLASSERGDIIIDPFSGSGTTLVVAEQLGRMWLGCEMNPTYNQWAIERLQTAQCLTDQEWFWLDRRNEERRRRIRI